jgi:hypothetical protein
MMSCGSVYEERSIVIEHNGGSHFRQGGQARSPKEELLQPRRIQTYEKPEKSFTGRNNRQAVKEPGF